MPKIKIVIQQRKEYNRTNKKDMERDACMADDNRQFPPVSDAQKEELYLYSLKKMAEANNNSNLTYMTQLLNLRTFQYNAGEIMRAYPDKTFAMLVLDIANFKCINEFCGRDTGDEVLMLIADTLRNLENDLTVASHFRADNFGLFMPFQEESELVETALHIVSQIDAYKIPYKILPSIGICIAPNSDTPPSIMRDYATMALKTIKGKFYAKYAFFDESMRQQMLLEKQIENEIVAALNTQQLQAYIQPKVDMSTGEIIGGEALVRWIHPEKNMISPGQFIPVLEKNGLIIDVDICIWTQIFEWLSRRIKEGKKVVPISINISRMHAYDNIFKERLVQLSRDYDVPPSLVALELTESSFLTNTDGMYESMQYLKNQGFLLSMDDFGTGYSTMTMLKNQPVDEIKIDKGFIDDIEDTREQIIVSNILRMLKALDKKIIVEGVETQAQRQFLLEQDCIHAQGFLFYKPMPIAKYEALLDDNL